MLAYNHEKYIAQAIESALMQATNFQVEVVIGEDCSTDGTREIVRRYAASHPDKIRALLPEHNLGVEGNSRTVLNSCRGEYFAWLEGDDYWTDPHKLQKQVDFLENNRECVLCFHNALLRLESDWLGDAGVKHDDIYDVSRKSRATFADFVAGFCPPSCSCVLVNDRDKLRPVLTGQLPCYGVMAFYCLTSAGGVGGYVPETMGVYRLHAGGVWSPLSSETKQVSVIKADETARAFFNDPRKRKLFDAKLFEDYILLAREQALQGRIGAALRSYTTAIGFLRHWPRWTQVLFIIAIHSRIALWPLRRAVRVFSRRQPARLPQQLQLK